MRILVDKVIYDRLQEESYLYHAGVAPVENHYQAIVDVQYSVILILLVVISVSLVGYFYEKSLKKYYKECLNANFGWFGKK